jgi:two-component system OmpR family sensor kinase
MRNLTFSLVGVVLIATIGLGWMFDGIYNQYLNQNLNESHKQSLNKNSTQTSQGRNASHDFIGALEKVGTHLVIALSAIDNRQDFVDKWPSEDGLSLRLKPLTSFPLPAALLTELKTGQPLLLETDDSIAMHFYLSATDELLVLTTPPQIQSQNNSLLPILLTSLFYLAVLLLMLLWLYPLVRRLIALRRTAKSFGEGNLNQRIDVGSISYIRDLELEFNRMAQRIDDLVTDIKLLSSAVSHDLRTPLARIRFGIDTIQEEDDPVLRKRFEQRISDNVDEMVDLVESLLSYARLDQTLITLNKAPVDFLALTATCIKNKSQDDVQLTCLMPKTPVFVEGDLSYLMILMSNLLQNAHQYCQRQINVTVIEHENNIVVTVEDDGPGIPSEQREQILKPFIRGKNTEQKVKGYGMGLAIVKRIVEWHHGEVIIEHSSKLQGAQFTVTLPKTS